VKLWCSFREPVIPKFYFWGISKHKLVLLKVKSGSSVIDSVAVQNGRMNRCLQWTYYDWFIRAGSCM